jgi:hypothetical protein
VLWGKQVRVFFFWKKRSKKTFVRLVRLYWRRWVLVWVGFYGFAVFAAIIGFGGEASIDVYGPGLRSCATKASVGPSQGLRMTGFWG